jgi:cell division protein FtsW (lipid II flippase)
LSFMYIYIFIYLYLYLFKRREENQLDATECFIAIIICSTCFGHLYAHHQELETILVLLLHMVCYVLVAGGRRSGAGQQAMRPG